eukprot:TRINITY_DN3509_c0_g1_i2.p1 TRINITY_DN3509_c0_g1~~TRINITY_DN3509_c0_g1_i2.p1  ORF type:complete len:502 (+),score=96.00 TRINITY_DN3509_c0_g1_i2:217-1722(+)
MSFVHLNDLAGGSAAASRKDYLSTTASRKMPDSVDDILSDIGKDNDTWLRNPSGSPFSGTMNLVCSVIARGILVLPFAFSTSGILLGGLMLATVAFLSYIGCSLTIATVQALLNQGWAHKRTMLAVSLKLFGRPGAMLVRFSMLNFLIGTMSGFVVLLGNLVTPLLSRLPFNFPVQVVQLIAVLFFMFPLTLLRRYHSLRFTSALSLIVYVYLIIVVAVRGVSGVLDKVLDNEQRLFREPSTEFFTQFPVMTLAFCIQFELLPTWQELRNPTPKRITRVVMVSVGLVWFVLFLVAAFGYLAFYHACDSSNSSLSSFMSSSSSFLSSSSSAMSSMFSSSSTVSIADDWDLMVGRLGIFLITCLTVPLLCFPIRVELDTAIFKHHQPTPLWRRAMWSAIVLGLCYTIAAAVNDTTIVFSVTSALAGCALIYIFPALFFLKMDGMLYVGGDTYGRRFLFWIVKGNWTDLRRCVSFAMILVGIFFTMVSVWACFQSTDKGMNNDC